MAHSVISALRRLRQDAEFEARLGYLVRLSSEEGRRQGEGGEGKRKNAVEYLICVTFFYVVEFF